MFILINQQFDFVANPNTATAYYYYKYIQINAVPINLAFIKIIQYYLFLKTQTNIVLTSTLINFFKI